MAWVTLEEFWKSLSEEQLRSLKVVSGVHQGVMIHPVDEEKKWDGLCMHKGCDTEAQIADNFCAAHSYLHLDSSELKPRRENG